jgi:hypothetical protein
MRQKLAGAALAALFYATIFAGSAARAAEPSTKPIRIWNLTASTVTDFRLAKAGSPDFGPNLTLDDPDKTIDVDERLKLPNLAPGVYDARLTLKDGRTCAVKTLKIDAGAIVGIDEALLRDCVR